jgi:hypothetical protein
VVVSDEELEVVVFEVVAETVGTELVPQAPAAPEDVDSVTVVVAVPFVRYRPATTPPTSRTMTITEAMSKVCLCIRSSLGIKY